MLHRRQLLTAVGIATISGLAGCSGSDDTEPSAYQTTDYRTVEIQNKGNQSREVAIEISRDGELLHEGTHNISAGKTQLIYNTSSDDLGSASIRVNVSTDSDNLTRTNSDGPNQPPIEIEPNGNLTADRIVY